MCFVPQRHALLRHRNFQSGPALRCFVHFDFEMCFAPQQRAIFHLSSGQLAPHPPPSLLFDPPEPQIIRKTQCFATFLPFAHLHLLSSYSFSSIFFFLLNLSLPSASSLLCFSSVHIVGSLTSKLPPITVYYITRTILSHIIKPSLIHT